MKNMYKVLALSLLSASGPISAYTFRVANITDQALKIKFVTVWPCKDHTEEMVPTGDTYSVIEYFTHENFDLTKLGCALNKIEVTNPTTNVTKTANPLKKLADGMFLIELDESGENIKITPFLYDPEAFDKQIVRAKKNLEKIIGTKKEELKRKDCESICTGRWGVSEGCINDCMGCPQGYFQLYEEKGYLQGWGCLWINRD